MRRLGLRWRALFRYGGALRDLLRLLADGQGAHGGRLDAADSRVGRLPRPAGAGKGEA
jgi:hypothetical protein